MSLAKAHLDDNAREILHHNWSLHVAQRGNCFLSTSKRKIKLLQFVFFLKRIRKVPFSLGNFNPEATPAVPGYRVSFANLFGSITVNCKSSKGQMIKPQSSLLNLPQRDVFFAVCKLTNDSTGGILTACSTVCCEGDMCNIDPARPWSLRGLLRGLN